MVVSLLRPLKSLLDVQIAQTLSTVDYVVNVRTDLKFGEGSLFRLSALIPCFYNSPNLSLPLRLYEERYRKWC
jgi:hypothetical protein